MNSTIDTSWRGIRRQFLEVLGVWVPVAFLFFGKAGGWFEGIAFLGLCAMAMFDDSGERRWSSWRLWGVACAAFWCGDLFARVRARW